MWLLRGACMVAWGGMHDWGHAWLLLGGGGMCGCSPGGGAWLLQGGVCVVALGGVCGCSGRGMCGCLGGNAWLLLRGVHGCSGGLCIGYDEIQRYSQ